MRKKVLFAFSILIAVFSQTFGQQAATKPKLVVGIVVDQMRPEYLYRFYNQFGENGFKRLMNEGFVCANTHINYIPTVAGPGHASIYSGTSPMYHGIIANNWYDRNTHKSMYCATDTLAHTVGNDTTDKWSYSARNLLVTNISDELKIATNQKGIIIGMSLKDRGAAMPAGHMADGAYWFDHRTGNFVSSSYYMEKLPDWVSQFNAQHNAERYLAKTWDLLLPESAYTRSLPDDNPYEEIPKGKTRPVFPYNLTELSKQTKNKFDMVYDSPFGNSLLADFAVDALQHAGLGTDDYTDILAISFSSTDAVGHAFGPLSREVNDTYLRLDRDLARLFDALDKTVGKGNYTLFLTADHGVAEVSQYLADHKVPVGYLDTDSMQHDVERFMKKTYGEGKWVEAFTDGQFYLNRDLIAQHGLTLATVQDALAFYLKSRPGIDKVYTSTQLDEKEYTTGLAGRLQKGFYYKRCGDVFVIMDAGWLEKWESATSHGTGFSYDTNIPLIWYGAGIKHGESYTHYNVTDIAPTISALLKIKYPGACIGNPITEVFAGK